MIAASGPQAAELAGQKGDGLMATEPRKELVDAYGGKGPRYCEVAMCCDKSAESARQTTHKYFRWSLTGWPVQAELPDIKGFDAASKCLSPETVAAKISGGPSAEKHLKAIGEFGEAGFDHIVLVQVGPD